ncbi:MAG TPA: hypothetical protein VLK58_17550, partial [Conexibacter sp.]|nr:hypothetical protein [Conexibacter sp.]
ARFFRWRSGAGTVTKPCDLCGVNGLTKRWVTDSDAGTNISYYSGWADQPTGDFAAAEWRAEARRILEHWLDTGLDGFIVDAITEMVDCDASCLRSTITDTIHAYPGRMAAAETPRDATAIGYGFDATTDQAFWGNQIATSAIARQNPSSIDDGLWTRDGITAAGGTALSAPDLTRTSDAATHLLQVATIAASGNQLLVWDPGDGFGSPSTWAGEGASFKAITDAVVANPALQSQGARTQVATDDDTKTYAFVRTSVSGTQKALAVFNYTNAARTVTVNLAGGGVGDGATTNLLAAGAGPTISGGSVTVRLPAWGYAFYGVPLPSSSCATNLCGSLTTASGGTVDLTATGTADWAHWGTSSATSFDHKSGAGLISDRTAVGSGTITRYANNAIGYSWSGGTPTASATASTTGIYVTGVGNGFRFTVPADTTARRLLVHVGAWEARGRLVATLSDGSASSYTSTSLSAGSGSSANGTFALAYRAARAGQTLTVTWTVDSTVTSNGNVTLQSAALQGGGGSGPTTTVIDDAASGWSWGGGWNAYADGPSHNGTAHGGSTVGAWGSYTFTGSAVRVRSWKEAGAGSVEVFLDGVSQGVFSEDNGGAEAYGQLLFSHRFASSGTHTIRLVATTSAWTMVDALEVDS